MPPSLSSSFNKFNNTSQTHDDGGPGANIMTHKKSNQ